MKLIFIITLVAIMLSWNMSICQTVKNDDTVAVIGSTVANINEAEFSMVQFEIDEKPCFATISLYFKDYKHMDSCPTLFGLLWKLQRKIRMGTPPMMRR